MTDRVSLGDGPMQGGGQTGGPAVADTLAALPWQSVVRVADCRLRVVAGQWDYALRNAEAIDAHWRRRQSEQPAMFNGRVFALVRATLSDDVFSADFVVSEFKAYLFWRENGHPEAGARDGFGSALIRAADDAVLLGRQRDGNINAGLLYPPGGFIDARDVRADGSIDIAGSIAREVGEETRLPPSHFTELPGYWVTFSAPHISIAREFRSPLPAEALIAEIARQLAAEADSELVELVAVRKGEEVEATAPLYGRLLTAAALG